MQSTDWLKFLFGNRAAIRNMAQSSGAIWAGVALVVLTGIARNYDQTFITENPVMWMFGSLLFSFVSGSWLYVVLYGFFTRREMADADGVKPDFWSGWRSFMGLFWLTAPIAWLYAIPVERFCDSLLAAKLNITLLALVSLWRVLLMARVMQVVTSASFAMALVWVLFAAALEVCVVFFLGDGFGKRLMAAMGGMRNSPEEEILVSAMGTAFSFAFWTVPISFLLGLFWRTQRVLNAMPTSQPSPMPWRTLGVLAVFWVAMAIVPQRELSNSVAVERLIASGESRAALDYLAARQPGDFAPDRVLPPKPYEREFFSELPACFGVVRADDPLWVRSHLMRRLNQMLSHYSPHWSRKSSRESLPEEMQIEQIASSIGNFGPDPGAMLQLLNGLDRIPEGNGWLKTNSLFLDGVRTAIKQEMPPLWRNKKADAANVSDWLVLSKHRRYLDDTNAHSPSKLP